MDFRMPDMGDPMVILSVAAAAALLLLLITQRVIRGAREARRHAERAREIRQARGYLYMQQQELERLAGRILATSSTGSIAGFDIVRQIEAVYTDGHISPVKAIEVLKAVAAEKGANAIIHLVSERAPAGKCGAHGDAVVVRPVGESSR
jgi:hypothetical protein